MESIIRIKINSNIEQRNLPGYYATILSGKDLSQSYVSKWDQSELFDTAPAQLSQCSHGEMFTKCRYCNMLSRYKYETYENECYLCTTCYEEISDINLIITTGKCPNRGCQIKIFEFLNKTLYCIGDRAYIRNINKQSITVSHTFGRIAIEIGKRAVAKLNMIVQFKRGPFCVTMDIKVVKFWCNFIMCCNMLPQDIVNHIMLLAIVDL